MFFTKKLKNTTTKKKKKEKKYFQIKVLVKYVNIKIGLQSSFIKQLGCPHKSNKKNYQLWGWGKVWTLVYKLWLISVSYIKGETFYK